MNQDHLIGEFDIPLNMAVMFKDGIKTDMSLNLKVLLDNFDLFKEKTNHDPMKLSPEMVSVHFSHKRDLLAPLRIIALDYDSTDQQLIENLKERIYETLGSILSQNGIKLIKIDKLNLLVSGGVIENSSPQKQMVVVRKTSKAAVFSLTILLVIIAAAFAVYYIQSSTTIRHNNATIKQNDLTISTLESDVETMNEQVESLSNDIKQLNQDKEDLNVQLISIQNDLNELDEKYSALEDTNESMTLEINRLESDLTESEEELDLYKDTYGSVVTSGIQPPFGWYVNRLYNESTAEDPTYEELISFLKKDKIDQNIYVVNKYMCGHFASDLHNAAEEAGYRAAFVAISFRNQTEMHACNAFKTTDKGLIFIDVTGRQADEIKIYSYDKIVDVEIGKKYIPDLLFPDSSWSITFTSMGTVSDVQVYW